MTRLRATEIHSNVDLWSIQPGDRYEVEAVDYNNRVVELVQVAGAEQAPEAASELVPELRQKRKYTRRSLPEATADVTVEPEPALED